MWTLIFLAFAQADDILADEAKGKKAAATKIAEPAAVPPAGVTKPGEPRTRDRPHPQRASGHVRRVPMPLDREPRGMGRARRSDRCCLPPTHGA